MNERHYYKIILTLAIISIMTFLFDIYLICNPDTISALKHDYFKEINHVYTPNKTLTKAEAMQEIFN